MLSRALSKITLEKDNKYWILKKGQNIKCASQTGVNGFPGTLPTCTPKFDSEDRPYLVWTVRLPKKTH